MLKFWYQIITKDIKVYSLKSILAIGVFSCSLAFTATAVAEDAQEVASSQNAEPIKVSKAQSIYDVQVGDDIYVSEAANVWLRSCPATNCKIQDRTHVGKTFKFVKMSEDKKFILVDDGNRSLWMQTRDLQIEPCGKAKVEILEGEIANLKNSLANFDSEAAVELKKANAKIEKLEKENAALKNSLTNQTEKIEDLDATRRDYADKLETKDLDMQMRWWIQGAVIAFCGALIGIICVYIPRPNRRKKQMRY